jgi:orotate phosphoribosyltransferase
VDDVITAGTAIRDSAKLINEHQAKLKGVLIAIDRQEKGKETELSAIQQVEQEYGIQVISIVGLSDIIDYLKEKGGYEEAVESMLAYRKEWGI